MVLIRPRVYRHLIYYRRRVLLKVLVESLIATILILAVAQLIYQYYQDHFTEVVIIGSGRYPGIINSYLQASGYRCQVIIPPCLHQISLPINDLSIPWSRLSLTQRYLPIDPNIGDQLPVLAESFGLDLETLQKSHQDLVEKSVDGQVDLCSLPVSHQNCHRDEIISLKWHSFKNRFTIKTLGGLTLKSRYLVVIQTTHLGILQKYLDFSQVSHLVLEIATDQGTSRQTVEAAFHPETGFFSLAKEISLPESTREVYPISLKMPLRPHQDNLVFLDDLHLLSEYQLLVLLTGWGRLL